MAKAAQDAPTTDLRDFFTASEARIDRWRTLNRVAKTVLGAGPARTGTACSGPCPGFGEPAEAALDLCVDAFHGQAREASREVDQEALGVRIHAEGIAPHAESAIFHGSSRHTTIS
jgi:hypothetical protein